MEHLRTHYRMLIEEQEQDFVFYEEAIALKELGYDKPCLGYWSSWSTQEPFLLTCELGTEIESCAIRRKDFLCKAPTYLQAFKWLHQKLDIKKGVIPLDVESQQLLLKELIIKEIININHGNGNNSTEIIRN